MRASISSTPTDRGPAPPGLPFERQLLELAQQPLLALADLRDERLGGRRVERQPEASALLARPLGRAPTA